MARRNITFNGFDLQDTTYKVQEIEHESMDAKTINMQRLGARDGGVIVGTKFAPKAIKIKGVVTGTDISDLETNIDTLKLQLNAFEKNLDIDYESGTRRYVATARAVKITRRHFNITFAPFEVDFIISDPPFGQALDTSTASFSIVDSGTGTWAGNHTFNGTAAPIPSIQLTFNTANNVNSVQFTNAETGDSITVPRTFAAAEVLTIDTDDYTVTVDGTAVDFIGFFPAFVAAGNDFKLRVDGNSYDITMKLIYRALYL